MCKRESTAAALNILQILSREVGDMVATGGVLLGMAGDMIDESDNRTHYMTKIGGSPWYPKLGSGPQQKIPTCDICGQDLALVLQVKFCTRIVRVVAINTWSCVSV